MDIKKRPLCLHFHIFKNAGQTLQWISSKNFSKNTERMDTETPSGILPNKIFLGYLNRHPEVKFFSSHQIRFPTPESDKINFIPILFIRHPIDRIFSIYDFEKRRTDSNDKITQKAKSLTLNDFIKWNLEGKKNLTLINFQVQFLSDKKLGSIVNEDDLILAVNRIKSCPVLGVVDRFDQSLVVAEEVLCHHFNEIDLSYVKQNISSNRKTDFIQRIEEEKSLVEENVMKNIEERNHLDFELYSQTNIELDKRLKTIDDFELKLKDFQNRCKKIAIFYSKTKQLPRNNPLWYSIESNYLYYNDENGNKISCQ